ncbi:MAG: hypothetical protein HYV95_08980 [Opitutae bacterium]|nr:hypothetical protein [Opitutae bacterium]
MENSAALPSRRRFLLGACALLLSLAALPALRTEPAANALSANSQPPVKMKQFVIIFRQGPRTLTEADLARRQSEVSAWARVQNAAGHKLEPRILAPDGLRPWAADTAGEHAGFGEWPLTALLFLVARDLAEAAQVAASHPAKNFGAHVEVRPWAPPVLPAPAR